MSDTLIKLLAHHDIALHPDFTDPDSRAWTALRDDWPVGTVVQRVDRREGRAPVYLWRGVVCGHYVNPKSGTPGVDVGSFAEFGAAQVFPLYMLERLDD